MLTAVEDLMSRKPITLTEADDLGVADALIKHRRIRHLPVVREGRLVGLVTSTNLVRAEAEQGPRLASTTPVAEVMTREVRTIRARTPIRRAAKIMLEAKIGCLPVVDAENRLLGILTETDLVRFAADMATDMDQVDQAICRGLSSAEEN